MQRVILAVTFALLTSFATFTLAFAHFQHGVDQAARTGQCVNIPATPNYLATGNTSDAVAAINHARIFEHLPALRLPKHFYELQPVQQQFILVNLERTDRGLPALTLDAHLSAVARAYSKQLSDLQFFSHTSPIGGSFSDRINNDPLLVNHYSSAAENLAGNPVAGVGPIYEYLYNDKAEACGHRVNILNPRLTYVGIGIVDDPIYGSMSAQEFIASAPWQPYQPAQISPAAQSLSLVIHIQRDTRRALLNCQAHASKGANVVRFTWFTDRLSTQPAHVGASYSLKLAHLSRGRHTLYAYVVDSGQNYAVAHITFQV